MLWETISVVRDLPRLHEIATIMIRYGWGDMVRVLGIGTVLERAGRILHWQTTSEIDQLDPAVRIRRAMEELGPTFVKLGQLFATRVDMFPPAWIAEFEKLQSHVPPVDFVTLEPYLHAALGMPVNEAFTDFDPVPFAAASVAQVHRARLPDGTPVILKVRRPDIEKKIEADLRIMQHIARLAEHEIPDVHRYQPIMMLAQFRRSLRRELDLLMEAHNIDRFRTNFLGDASVHIPRVYWEHTSEILNVQEELRGIPGTHLNDALAAGLDLQVLAARGADAVLKMILVHGYFHADPHPGNVIYLPGNTVGIIDFGMVGRLTAYRRNQIVDLLDALARKDEEGMLAVLLDWTGDGEVDEARLGYDVSELVFSYDNLQLKDVKLGTLLTDITAIIRDNALVLPADLALLFKALITLEGLGQQLDPTFHMVDHLTPFVRDVIAQRYQPAALIKRGRKSLKEALEVVTGLPRDLARLMREARRGRLRIDLDLKRLDQFGQQLDRASSRITMGILTASLVIGSSIVMTVEGWRFLGILGFLLAFLNSLWVIFSIWRAGKP
ncbi:AarF/ABC1/UbiB kinase family protein [Sulfuriferula sp.]|uniref:ABC1 kinase family protein n=1 Tax=Sulfuriferula sp. TaxID=2025307 RepID=UPI00272F4779|nr:AarF/UbiB family protein [Sulfuriferula sp.]MDP2026660.1 AarF/UbiB family protein [Sulfuriferula sp.]